MQCCIHCSSSNFVLNGHDKKGVQRYKCKDCHKRFCEKGIFARHRYPSLIIIDAIFLYCQPISTRGVVKNLERFRKIKPSHVSIYKWIVKFASYLIALSKKKQLNFSSEVWHVDEKFIHVRNSKDPHAYLWIVSDNHSNVIATHVSFKRDIQGAIKVFEKAKLRTEFIPEIIVSDGLQGYKRACKKAFGRKTRHVVAHFEAVGIVHNRKLIKLSNNRAERMNQYPALRLHAVRGFKRLDRANLLIELFMVYFNYLMPRGIEEKVKVRWEQLPEMIETINPLRNILLS